MPNPRLAAAYAVSKNNRSRGSIPNVSSLVGGKTSPQHPEPSGDYQEVEDLHRAVGSAIVDKIMGARKFAEGGEAGEVNAEEEGDFLSPNDDDRYADEVEQRDSDNEQGISEENDDDQTGEGDKSAILNHIMSALRKRNMGKR